MLAAAVSIAGTALPESARGAAGDDSPPQQQITVTADRLVSDRTARTATFSGRVKVVRGDSTIEADRLTVYYGEKASTSKKKTAALPGQSAVERIIAEGNVQIRSAELSARTPKAIYSRAAQTIELLGAGTRVISGSNSITGSKIVLHLEGEQLTVLGSDENRVKAVFEPSTKNKSP